MEIAISDIYRTFKEKELREKAAPDEKVKFIMGCPTLVKKSTIEVLMGRVMGLGRGANE